MYHSELAVYRELIDLQGQLILKLIATVHLNDRGSTETEEFETPGDFVPFRVNGILLEYVRGRDLFGIVNHFLRSSWQRIVDQALDIVRATSDRNILNKDVSPTNFIVGTVPNGTEGCHTHVFTIEFGLCGFRRPDETDFQWGRAKSNTDEEGAVGLRIKKALADHGFGLHYEDSLRYAEWADTDDSIPESFVRTELSPGVVMFSSPQPLPKISEKVKRNTQCKTS